MRTTRRALTIATALSAAALLTVTGCSSSNGSDSANTTTPTTSAAGSPTTSAADTGTTSQQSSPATSPSSESSSTSSAAPTTPTTLHVWMQGDTLTDIGIENLNKEFEAAHPGVTVDLQQQTWDQYTTKVATGLADTSGNAPDVLELGNTQVAQFAGAGALLELNASDFEHADTWLKGLTESSTYNGKLIAVPYYAGVRVGIYRTDLTEASGVNPPYNSLADLQAAAAKLLAAHGDDGSFSGLYFPSQYWYEGMSFVWDAGGDIATQNADGTWKGALDSAAAKTGLKQLKDFVDAVSRGGEGTNEADDATVMAQGQTAMFIDASWKPGVVIDPKSGNPDLKDKIGIFVVPGSKPGTVMPQFLGGSDIAINAKTPNKDLAIAYTQLLTGEKYQSILASKGYIANSTFYKAKDGDETAAIVVKAASNGRFVPNSKNWTKVEDGNVLQNMFDEILTGQKSIDDATAAASAKITELLNS